MKRECLVMDEIMHANEGTNAYNRGMAGLVERMAKINGLCNRRERMCKCTLK